MAPVGGEDPGDVGAAAAADNGYAFDGEGTGRLLGYGEPSAYGKEPIILIRRGKGIAAVVPIEDLELLERLEDEIDP